jgi:ATP-dependent RNA helicase DHX8/PRP22
MIELDKLQQLGLISKVCSALDAHLGFSDKTLAEFILHLFRTHIGDHADDKGVKNADQFQSILCENGAEFPMALTELLYTMIGEYFAQASRNARKTSATGSSKVPTVPRNAQSVEFPGLSIPNTSAVPLEGLSEEHPVQAAQTGMRSGDRSNSSRNRSGDNKGSSNDSHSRSAGDVTDSREDKTRNRTSESDERHREKKRSRFSSEDGGRTPLQVQERNLHEPELYCIYPGKVTNILDFGCFVEINGPTRAEGLVHIAHMSRAQVRDPHQEVKRGQRVFVKVISRVGTKLSLSMKEADQQTGVDLLPQRSEEGLSELHNSLDASSSGGSRAVAPRDPTVVKILESEERERRSGTGSGRGKVGAARLTQDQLWEARQLAQAGVLSVSELPTFDSESGMGILQSTEVEEDVDIELNEDEPAFLRGQTKVTRNIEPVRIVKNPDGSMGRAAVHQVTLAKERRELKQAQANNLIDAIPKDLSKPWEDPMPEAGERHFAAELRSINVSSSLDLPEWREKTQGKAVSYGQISSKSILEQRESLPVYRLKKELCQAIAQNQVLVVIGETGSGKTTQMTQYMLEMGYGAKGMIGCTQPRRVAAMSVAKRVAEEFGCPLGQEIGYTIRFEDCTSAATRLKYMTDGMLMREYLADNSLSRYVAMMLDEAHERTIHTDVLFGLLKNLLKERDDFKLIVTSATLDADKFSRYFFDCPIFTIPGRTFPVEILYVKEPEEDYLEACMITAMTIHLQEPAGDILIFLTGQEEIDTCAETLYTRMKALGDAAPELIILPVYGALPSEVQSRIFEPAPEGARKCVIATNIAEASLTIDGIYYVIDPGFCKQKIFNPKLGMDSLMVTPISAASARQRAGRAGRTGPGKCYRLYTENAYSTEMMASSVPEIQRTNLGNVVLQLKAMGINDLIGFDFMDPPPLNTLVNALESLFNLGALDDEGLLTRLGRKMAEFPLEPSLSKMLIISAELSCAEEILTIVSMLSVEPPWYRPRDKQSQADQKKAKFNNPDGDHLSLLAVYEGWKASKFSSPWCFENFIQGRSMKRAQDVRKQLVLIMDRYKMDILSCGRNLSVVRKCIVAGYFINAAKRDPQEGYKTMVEGTPVFIHPGSSLFNKNPEWVIYHELVLTSKEYMRNVLSIDAKWLTELAPAFYKKGDPTQMSRTKRNEKIEPLFDRFNPPDSWRLSKRKG